MTTFFSERVGIGEHDLGDAAAHHARVKRLEAGEAVSITDGRGRRGQARLVSVAKSALVVDVTDVETVPAPPAIHLFVPVADRDRMLWVAEKAAELQVASWTPVMYERSRSVNPRGEGEAFTRKVEARMIGALEQSGGAWLPAIEPAASVAAIASRAADASRAAIASRAADASRVKIVLERGQRTLGDWIAGHGPVQLAIGPEGGFTPAELAALLDAGWTAASFGDVTLRFETAAIGAVAICRALLS